MSREASFEEHLVRRFTSVVTSRDLSILDEVLALDCVDKNPYPIQPPGRAGVKLKAALFFEAHPGYQTVVDEIVPVAGGIVTASWTTTFATGHRTRWRGRFWIERGTIQQFETERVD